MIGTWVLVLSLAVASNSANEASQYTECQSSAQCGPGKCCVVVRGRYYTTTCMPLRRLGQECRPPSETPFDVTLNYPGGASVNVTGVHESLCPCEPSTACEWAHCMKKTR